MLLIGYVPCFLFFSQKNRCVSHGQKNGYERVWTNHLANNTGRILSSWLPCNHFAKTGKRLPCNLIYMLQPMQNLAMTQPKQQNWTWWRLCVSIYTRQLPCLLISNLCILSRCPCGVVSWWVGSQICLGHPSSHRKACTPRTRELLLEGLPWCRDHLRKPMRKNHCSAPCDLPSHKQRSALHSRRGHGAQWHRLGDSWSYLCPQNWRVERSNKQLDQMQEKLKIKLEYQQCNVFLQTTTGHLLTRKLYQINKTIWCISSDWLRTY